MDLALTASLILFAGICSQWLGWFLKQPSILFLLLTGIALGPIFDVIHPDELLGDWLFPFISLGVAVILFEGAMTLEFHEIRKHGRVVTNLVTFGMLITVAIMGFSAYYLFSMDWQVALLFGTLVCVTGPTVIVPMLRSIRPNKNISNILRWEGILVDPIGALMVVLVYTFITSKTHHEPLIIFFATLLLGVVIGLTGAFFLVFIIKRYLIPEYLKNVFTLSIVLTVYTISNAILHESGLVTVTIMGIVLANWPKFPKEEILHFKESLSVILISFLFIILAARIELDSFKKMGFTGIFILFVAMFIARPISVWISAIGSQLTSEEKWMISWISPRGIIAAAVSSLFVLRLEESALEGIELMVPLVFTIIIGTVFFQSIGAKKIAQHLSVDEPHPNGVIIAGGNNIALAIGASLKTNGFSVIIANPNYQEIRKARMAGLETYLGSPVSEYADRHLSLIGIGSLFAMSGRSEANILAALKYRHEFGSKNVYRLKNEEATNMTSKEKTTESWQTPWLFGENITFSVLNSMLDQGATIKSTNITADFSYEEYIEEKRINNQKTIPLYAVSASGKLKVFSSHREQTCRAGQKIVALVLDNDTASSA